MKRKPGMITLRSLAKLLGKSTSTISGWLNAPSWPHGRPPWPRRLLPAILRTCKRLIENEGGSTELVAARIGYLEAQLRLIEHENRLTAGEYCQQDRLDGAMEVIASGFRAALKDLAIYVNLCGESPESIKRQLRTGFERILEHTQKELERYERQAIAHPRPVNVEELAAEVGDADAEPEAGSPPPRSAADRDPEPEDVEA